MGPHGANQQGPWGSHGTETLFRHASQCRTRPRSGRTVGSAEGKTKCLRPSALQRLPPAPPAPTPILRRVGRLGSAAGWATASAPNPVIGAHPLDGGKPFGRQPPPHRPGLQYGNRPLGRGVLRLHGKQRQRFTHREGATQLLQAAPMVPCGRSNRLQPAPAVEPVVMATTSG